jgi:hypothetical protein
MIGPRHDNQLQLQTNLFWDEKFYSLIIIILFYFYYSISQVPLPVFLIWNKMIPTFNCSNFILLLIFVYTFTYMYIYFLHPVVL